MAYLKAAVRESYDQMAAVQQLLELLDYRQHEWAYKKRTQIGVGIIEQMEREGHFAQV